MGKQRMVNLHTLVGLATIAASLLTLIAMLAGADKRPAGLRLTQLGAACAMVGCVLFMYRIV